MRAAAGERGAVKIIAAVARERSGPFAVEELDLEEPRDDEVTVAIAGAGI